MVDYDPQHLDSIFRALADPTRREMLRRLSRDELTVSELAAPCAMSLAAASKHIRMLEHTGLVRRRIAGRTHHLRLQPDALADAHAWLGFYERFWAERLGALDAALTSPDGGKEGRHDD